MAEAETPADAPPAPTAPAADGVHEELDPLQFRDPNQPNLHLLYWTRAPLDARPNARIVVWTHGVGEHSGRYRRVAARLLQETPSLDAIVAYDLRAHGRSEGARGVIRGMDELVTDLREHVLPRAAMRFGDSTRVVLAGHSLGGSIVLDAASRPDALAADEYGRVVGVVISAPAVRVPVSGVNRVLKPFAPALARLPGVRGMVKASDIALTAICGNAAVQKEFEEDTLTHDRLGLGLATDLLTSGDEAVARIRGDERVVLNSNTPVLLLHAVADKVTDIEGTRFVADALRECKQPVDMVEVEKALHEIHNETDENGAKVFFDSVSAFLERAFAADE